MLADRLRAGSIKRAKTLIELSGYPILNNRGTHDSTQNSSLSIKSGDVLLDTDGNYFFYSRFQDSPDDYFYVDNLGKSSNTVKVYTQLYYYGSNAYGVTMQPQSIDADSQYIWRWDGSQYGTLIKVQ